MAMVIKNNLSALNTLNTLNKNSSALAKSLQKVSSGMAINSAADDASGYAISERMRTEIEGLDQDIKNTQNAKSLMRTAEGALSSTVEILKTFKRKALDAANDTNTDIDRATIQKELDQLIDQIDDNANVTFNGKYLLNGEAGGNIAAGDHEVILSFMSYLDDANLSAQDALDKAINYASCGLFKDEEDLKKSFLSAMSGGDLYSTCGIDLDNKDTGAITGQDAGGDKEKTAESIVPEEYNPYTGGVPTGTTNINGLNVTWPDTGSDAAKEAIAKALNNEWLKNCMDLVNESYELNFQEPGTSVHSMTVNLDAAVPSGTLARVISSYNGAGITVGLELQVNMSYYSDLDLNNVNGYDNTSRQTYLDRVIAHEMTHALMAANITNFATLPHYIKEGAAELVHGIDDARKSTIKALLGSGGSARLEAALETDAEHEHGDDAYAAGYIILRYMAHQAANAEPEKKLTFQIGTRANQAIKVGLADMRAQALGLKKADGTTLSVATQKKATSALAVIDRAITKALNQQTSIGAVQSRLDYTEANLVTAKENVQQSESTIRDADMAKEMTAYTKNNVLLQSAQAMLSQANQNSSSVLSLLQ